MITNNSSKFRHRMFSFRTVFIILNLLIGQLNLISAQNSIVLIDDNFNSPGKSWKEIKLNGAKNGSIKLKKQSLTITNDSKVGAYGLYNLKPLSGNFRSRCNRQQIWCERL